MNPQLRIYQKERDIKFERNLRRASKSGRERFGSRWRGLMVPLVESVTAAVGNPKASAPILAGL